MGVATIYKPGIFLIINILFIFIISCSPVNLSQTQTESIEIVETKQEKEDVTSNEKNIIENNSDEVKKLSEKPVDTKLNKTITILFSDDNNKLSSQFIEIMEMGIYDKKLQNVNLEIIFFENEDQLKNILSSSKIKGKIYIGPIDNNNTKIVGNFCDQGSIFFSFSSDLSLADNCVYLINFFPKNELEQLFKFLDTESKVALLYPENKYGYMINTLIDTVADNSDAIIVNRASYKNDLSNVRDAIKELGKYELRKFELKRQKKILINRNDEKSKKRLKRLEKFKTTSDYEFTHILIADYGLNLLQVAPLLPYYDIDPNIVQFMGTGVIDDENFFFEPSLQGTIFPGIAKDKRSKLLENYNEIYNNKLIRVSTLPYDLIGLLNYIFSNNLSLLETHDLLTNKNIKFDGVDGSFYFKENVIERDLNILEISNGKAIKVN